MTNEVRSDLSALIAFATSTSVRVSTELVASSRISTDGRGEERPCDGQQLILPR